MNPTFQIRDLSIGYSTKKNEKIVAKKLTSELFCGELTCLLGSNGVGKSTLLRTLAGFQKPLSGEILLNNQNLSTYTELERAQRISVVLTEKILTPDLSVRELAGRGRLPYTGFWGRLSGEDNRIIDEALQQVGIQNMSERQILELSDGERQKVMIAKALAQQTPVILLDEPTAFLDFPSKVEIMQLLRRLSREMQKIIFLSTHDVDLAIQLAGTLWLMDTNGRIIAGKPQILAQNGYLENFFQSPDVYFNRESNRFKIKIHNP
ncbi:MAG: ABC transporter ATP-binding protein [Dysgonamonadaceae bacterium]|jgi:iron complex transport system ATP-binding protein|nr:ABC transporter ATP-binding protein [Dysgonamonadaceae bacterium]